jgi:hypothetical protein
MVATVIMSRAVSHAHSRRAVPPNSHAATALLTLRRARGWQIAGARLRPWHCLAAVSLPDAGEGAEGDDFAPHRKQVFG